MVLRHRQQTPRNQAIGAPIRLTHVPIRMPARVALPSHYVNEILLHGNPGKLKGPLKEFWSIDVNGPWRVIFKFRDGDAYEVEITDTHR
jgi:hypothetical protein